jgi:recombination protein RecA
VNDALAELMAKIVKKHGANSLFQASTRVPSPRWPSGSISLDMAMGGGWPTNVWTEIAGYPSSGKTAIVHKTIAACQAQDPDFEVLWVAVEEYDESWARTLGVDTKRVMIFEGHEMSTVYDLMVGATESKAFNMIVLDSLPALMPDEEGEKSIGDVSVSPGARMTGKFFRKARITRAPDGSERPMLGVFINQWREKVGGFAPHGQTPKTRPGGLAKDHAYALRLEVARAEYLVEDRPGRGKANVGLTMKATTAKNKTYAPGRVASVDFYFADCEDGSFHAGEYDMPKELAMMGALTEAITRAGAYYDVGGVRVKGRDGLLAHLRGDLTAQEELAAEIRRRALGALP